MRELVSFIVRATTTCVVAFFAFKVSFEAIYDQQRAIAFVLGNVAINMGLWSAWAAGRVAGESSMARLVAQVGSRLGQIRITINQGHSDD